MSRPVIEQSRAMPSASQDPYMLIRLYCSLRRQRDPRQLENPGQHCLVKLGNRTVGREGKATVLRQVGRSLLV